MALYDTTKFDSFFDAHGETYEAFRARVRRGARLLDRIRPSWTKEISVKKLDLSNCRLCVLGQLYTPEDDGRWHQSGYTIGLRHLEAKLKSGEIDTVEYGFDGDGAEVADRLWRYEIRRRRRAQRAAK